MIWWVPSLAGVVKIFCCGGGFSIGRADEYPRIIIIIIITITIIILKIFRIIKITIIRKLLFIFWT